MDKIKVIAIYAAAFSALFFAVGFFAGYISHKVDTVEEEVCCYNKADPAEASCISLGGVPIAEAWNSSVLKDCKFPK